MSSKFMENWVKEDERCPHCSQITKQVRGLNKQNLKRLVFAKPTIQDWMLFFIIIMVLLLAWRYNVETAVCTDTLNHIEETCMKYKTVYVMPNQTDSLYNFNLSTFQNANP